MTIFTYAYTTLLNSTLFVELTINVLLRITTHAAYEKKPQL